LGLWLLSLTGQPTISTDFALSLRAGILTVHAPRSDDGNALVLVVERDPNVRELESFFLNEAGYSVDFVEDGVAALALARERKPAIIVTEIMVPRLDGLALCRAVKQDDALSDTVVLIFSILAAHSRAREAGADAFLLKPLAERRLVQTVRELLARRAALHPGTEQAP
jgi:two-component system response regulator MprA